MATLTAGILDLAALRAHLFKRLPDYARPLFLRIQTEIQVTSTFKFTKTDLVRQGYDPSTTPDAIYFNDPEQEAFIRVDQPLFERIQSGTIFQRRRVAVLANGEPERSGEDDAA
jgi:fatty-acyl-CoA synthase